MPSSAAAYMEALAEALRIEALTSYRIDAPYPVPPQPAGYRFTRVMRWTPGLPRQFCHVYGLDIRRQGLSSLAETIMDSSDMECVNVAWSELLDRYRFDEGGVFGRKLPLQAVPNGDLFIEFYREED